jgi:hypothetical protein
MAERQMRTREFGLEYRFVLSTERRSALWRARYGCGWCKMLAPMLSE